MPSLVHQFAGVERDALGAGAMSSRHTAGLKPRTQTADRAVKSACPYCAVGYGQKALVKDEKIAHVEGVPVACGLAAQPFLFVASGITAAAAVGCAFAPAVGLVAAGYVLERRMGPLLAEPYRTGLGGFLKRMSGVLAIGGAVLGVAGRKNHTLTRVAACAAAAAGVVERFAVLEAGKQSALDPRYAVEPQRSRIQSRGS